MNSDEARTFLHACSLDNQCPHDSREAEALEQIGRDPELLAWFNRQRALDQAIASKLQQVRVPRDLAERILAEHKGRRAGSARRLWLPLGLAASLVLILGMVVLLWGKLSRQPAVSEWASFQSEMVQFLGRFPELDLATDQWPAILRWLGERPGFERAEIPAGFKQFPGLGCRQLQWRGKPLMLICLAARGEVVHLLIAPSATLPGTLTGPEPVLNRVQNWSAASWSQGPVAYLALTRGSEEFLRDLIRANPGPRA
jgi:hypothetical protein